MVGVKKFIVNAEDDLGKRVQQLRSEGFNQVTVFFSSHPKHKIAGLVASQVLVHAWRFQSRVDRKGKRVGE